MTSQTLSAIDSLAATLVPRLPEASRIALERTAHYYVVQMVMADAGWILACIALGVSARIAFKKFKAIQDDASAGYDDEDPWAIACCCLSVFCVILSVIVLTNMPSDIAFIADPVTGTILKLAGK